MPQDTSRIDDPEPKKGDNDETLPPDIPSAESPEDSEASTLTPLKDPSGDKDAETLPPQDVPASDVHASAPGYQIESELGRGGMGVVYRAVDQKLNRPVALKMILAGNLAADADVQRFHSEAEAVACLDHSGIVPIYEIGQHDGNHYFSMKLVEGGNLASRTGEFADTPEKAAALIAKLASAIDHAHRRGIMHRDLKPANILIDDENQPMITDFGLARHIDDDTGLTQTGAIIGTPSYMPPEQAQGSKQLTTSIDIYSLGAILYELLTGQPPHRGSNPIDTVLQVINEPVIPPRDLNPTVNSGLELICLKCLEKNPENRYDSAQSLCEELGHWIRGEPITVRTPSFVSQMRLWLSQNFGSAGWILVIGLVFGSGFGALAWMATVQEDVAQYSPTYDLLPNVQRPWLLHIDWLAPLWLRLAFLSLAILGIAYLGLFVAALVKPKNPTADVIAGGITSLVTGIAVFCSFIGVLSAMSSIDTGDLSALTETAFADPDGPEMVRLLARYPDLSNIKPEHRAIVLRNKIVADKLGRLPLGIWTGMAVSFALCLFAGIGESLAAGPIWRRTESWIKSFLPYSEMGLIVAAMMFLVGLFGFGPVVMSISGALYPGNLTLLVALMVLGLVAAIRQFHWPIRAIVQVLWIGLFLNFLFVDFIHMPAVGRHNSKLAQLNEQLRIDPDSARLQIDRAKLYKLLGDRWIDYEHWEESIGPLRQAITSIDELVSNALSLSDSELSDSFNLRYSSLRRLVFALEQLGQFDEARAELASTCPETPEQWRLVTNVCREHALARKTQDSSLDAVSYVRLIVDEQLALSAIPLTRREELGDVLTDTSFQEQQWSLFGPISGFAMEYENVARVRRFEPTNGLIDPPDLKPITRNQFAGSYVNLQRTYGATSRKFAYASISLTVPVAGEYTLHCGSDDGLLIILNDELQHTAWYPRVYKRSQDLTSVQLLKGRNTIVLKIGQIGGDWGFNLEVTDQDGWPINCRWNEFSPLDSVSH